VSGVSLQFWPSCEKLGSLGIIKTYVFHYSFLVLLMTYTVLGTLYNRYVLQLRGFDQIPQFSVESMKYHGREALDWIKDMIATLDIWGHANGGPSGGYNGFSSAATPTTNPVSHQSQVFSTGESQEDGAAFSGGSGGFIRPQASRARSAAFQRSETNPVSHQSQVNAQIAESLSFSSVVPHSPSPPVKSATHPESNIPRIHRSGPPDSHKSMKDEREFMLGDDDDAEELVDTSGPPPLPQRSNSSLPLPQGAASNISATDSVGSEENPAAALRGRDLGGGDVIRL
jgi:cation-dependent mannose-6-phosphate receptor